MQLQGDRIYLKSITIDDTDDIVRWRNEEFVKQNFIFREQFTKELHLEWFKNKVQTGQVIQFVIFTCDANQKIGSVYLRDVDKQKGEAEYGIFIGQKEALLHGYGSEACQMMVEYARKELGLSRLTLRLLRSNEPARRSYEKAGFRLIENKTDLKNNEEIIFMEIALDEN